MPIWGEVELLCRAILEQGRKEADEILGNAKVESEKIIASARTRAEKELQEQILAQRSKALLEARQIVDAAELEAKKRTIAFREDLMQEIFRALELRLKDVSNQREYPDFLVSAIKEGIDSLVGKEFIVELRQEDLELVKESIEALGRELSVRIQTTTSLSIEEGARVYTGDRRLLYDNSLSARLKRCEDEIQREIWRRFFAGERGQS